MSDDPTMSEMPPPRTTRASRAQPPIAPRPTPKAGPPTAAATTTIAATTTTKTTPTPTREAPPPEQKKLASDNLHRQRAMQDMNPDEVEHDELLDTVDEVMFRGRMRMGEPQPRYPEPEPEADLLLELALQVKMSEKTITAKVESIEQMLLKRMEATENWRASVTSDLQKLNDTINSSLRDIQISLNVLAWEKVDTEAKPKVPASLADSTAGAKGAAGATGKQLGAGMAGTAGGTHALNNQEGGGPNERFRNASILSVENTPILMDELKEIMRVGNLQYVLAYMTYYDDTAHKVKLSNANEDDVETLMEQGGVVLPHMKNCQDWDAFLADRRKWATRSHFTHCRAKN